MENEKSTLYALSLDGGGSLGVYTLGVLEGIASLIGEPLCNKFHLIYGTSTGSIIASLIALAKNIHEISEIYERYVPKIMLNKNAYARSKALRNCAIMEDVFGNKLFNSSSFSSQALVGVVATRTDYKRPMIFKSSERLQHGGSSYFVPGFGCSIADAVTASCSAAPFFEPHTITINDKNGNPVSRDIEVMDGGFVANNPTLYAITDAMEALDYKAHKKSLRVLNIGVGSYPSEFTGWGEKILRRIGFTSSALELFENVIASNNNAIEELRKIIYPDSELVKDSYTFFRASGNYQDPKTNFLESNFDKLMKIKDLGREYFRVNEAKLRNFFDISHR
jgi:predicted patatin/cPLA2 family phospholipase